MRQIRDYSLVKLLTDPRRLAILRLLMAGPATLTHLGQALDEYPARIRHHVKLLEQAGLVEQVETRVVRGFVEKYYLARAQSFLLQQLILPITVETGRVVTVMGSHDLALELLAKTIHEDQNRTLDLFLVPVGSLDGLVALRQGLANMAGCHLLDPDTGETNSPFIRRLFPDRSILLVTVVHRQQGLLVAPGNPLGIHSLADLRRPDVGMINRNRGSGTRIWLDRELNRLGLATDHIRGYDREVRTHTAAAEAVLTRQANVSLGLQAAAGAAGLDFIPLYEERFDLAVPEEESSRPRFNTIIEVLTSPTFRAEVEALGGYRTSETGTIHN